MKNIRSAIKLILAAVMLSIVCVWAGLTAYAEGTATISVESAYIRSSASTSGTIVGGAMKGDKLTILETTTDSAGNTWYKVQVDSTVTGYIRADLVSTSGDVPSAPAPEPVTSTETSTSTSTSTSTVVDTTPIISADLKNVVPVTGKTTGDVRVRKGPSTDTSVIDSVSKSTEVTITGYEDASDGRWYFLTYGSKTGYIRSDFVSLDGELEIPAAEEPVDEPSTEPEPEPVEEPEPVYMDYEVVYELDGNGDTVWYLNDYTEGTKNNIKELVDAKKQLEESQKKYEKALKKKQAGIVVLAIFVVLLIAGGAAAYVIFRRWYYGYDETEEVVTKKDVSQSTRPVTTGTSTVTKSTKPATSTTTKPSSDFKMETVGNSSGVSSAPQGKTVGGGVLLPDGRIQMPDGSVKRAVVGVRQPDGSIKLSDGRVKMPDGTIIRPDAPKSETSYPSQAKARNFASDEDDMDYGFLNIDSNLDEE